MRRYKTLAYRQALVDDLRLIINVSNGINSIHPSYHVPTRKLKAMLTRAERALERAGENTDE